MNVIALIHREHEIKKRTFLVLGLISSVSNTIILAVINATVEKVTSEEETFLYLAIFVVSILIFTLSQRELMLRAIAHVEEVINRLRKRFVTLIHHCELETIERVGKEKIYTTLGEELQTISHFSQLFVIAAQSTFLIFFSLIYIAFLSIPAFCIILCALFIGSMLSVQRSQEIRGQMEKLFEHENRVMSDLTDVIDGFKEIKLNRLKAEKIQQQVYDNSEKMTVARNKIGTLFTRDYVSSQISFYIVIGAIIFVTPSITDELDDLVKIAAATLFLIGPISSLVGAIPNYSRANAASRNIDELERILKQERRASHDVEPIEKFDSIILKDLYFQHAKVEGEREFGIGPIDLTIKKGQLIFVSGGNGSGKTTFLRLFTGLYPKKSGRIYVDDVAIDDCNIEAYRDMFSPVFSDFHLFKTLYGVKPFEQQEADELLRYMEIHNKVGISNNVFSTVKLSGGQRKRLGLIASLLEKRPICVFDEWAADQDPIFRHKFYTEILPKIKADGFTVLAITHDDKYFDCADAHYAMRDGKLELIELPEVQA